MSSSKMMVVVVAIVVVVVVVNTHRSCKRHWQRAFLITWCPPTSSMSRISLIHPMGKLIGKNSHYLGKCHGEGNVVVVVVVGRKEECYLKY